MPRPDRLPKQPTIKTCGAESAPDTLSVILITTPPTLPKSKKPLAFSS